jgi:DNA polymerase
LLAGVDTFLADTTHNALQSANLPPDDVSNIQNSQTRPATSALAQESNAACINARQLCSKAQTLDDLREIIERFEGCSLKFSANSTVFGYGNPHADLMLIGEAPGADEDRIGEPFVGRSGKLLDKMIQSIGLNRDECFISNVLPWRPPGNRPPTDAEIAVCLPFLHRQIELVSPSIILLLGASAANALLNNNQSISALRGKFLSYTAQNREIAVLCSFHPAYLLRNSAQKAKSWYDLLKLKEKMQELQIF